MNTDLREVEEIFLAALDHTPETRSAFLRTRCGNDQLLTQEVASMLRAHTEAGEFLETPAFETNASLILAAGLELEVGEALDSYRILSLLGEGGMGEVYLAEDTDLGRKVAIKLIKRGMAGADIVRHLRREARILAGLSHPNIARLYGAAVTPQGVPYFIMEYVDGERLDDYCNKRNLPTNERLELFRKVCSAVAYAHQHLVVHRDLKPANIRVTAEGEPKLLDFGIAKVLETETTQPAAHTQTLGVAMTPDYASPEQVSGGIITTVSDVYSLGVLLYELTTGQKPYRITSRRPDEVSRVIAEEQPKRPSAATANNQRSLRGDLDNIILMALRKEPSRRYPSVANFSEDLRCHLAGLPVAAQKDTWRYRSAKFIRRNRLAVAAAALIGLILLAGIVITAWEAEATRKEKAKAQSISAFLEQMISYSTPYLDSARTHGHASSMIE
ncbi:MAG: serine/threonine-protein kinase, partial [Chthoniobacterales bacterium]